MEPWRGEIARRLRGTEWIVAYDVAASATAQVAALESFGARVLGVVCGGRGTGPLADVPHLEMAAGGDGLMSGIRAAEHVIGALVPEALDVIDPRRRARALVATFSELRAVAGRPVFGPRDPRWVALEDKTAVDDLLDAAGVPRAPSRVVTATHDALFAAAAALDRGQGTVWAADNRAGWHGGADGLWWVRRADQAAQASEALAQRADLARVMPFLEGIPCSVHGWVLPTGDVLAFRPVEMLILRRPPDHPDAMRLVYARSASTWDPPADDRDAMREVARRVGRWLRDNVAYRGVFTVDGVLAAEGFLPTEVNTRYGGAFPRLDAGSGLPSLLLHHASIEGWDLDWRPAELEAAILAWADAHRTVAAGYVAPDGLRLLQVDPASVRPGASAAPAVAAALDQLRDAPDWPGPVVPARDLREGSS